MSATAPVHLVDDDSGVADACRFMLEGYAFTVSHWADPQRFLAEAELHGEGALILDMRMPGLDGHQVHQRLRALDSTLGVIVLTAHGDIAMAVEEMKLGAVDFLQKPVAGRALADAVEAALTCSRERVQQRQLAQRAATLSPREREIAGLVTRGLTNREIADQLSLAMRTVEVHRAHLMKKLGAERSADLVRIWQQLGAGDAESAPFSR